MEMVLEFDENNSAILIIRKNDDPLTLAKMFCFKYSVDPRAINALSQNILNAQTSYFQSDNASKKPSLHSNSRHS